MTKKTNIRRNVIIILALIIGIGVFILAKNDLVQIAETFRTANYKWMALAIFIIVIYLFLEPLSLHLCIRSRNKKISFIDSMIISTTSFFFNAITPFSSGGQPFQVYAFHKKEVSASDSTGALLVNFIVYQIVCAVICTVSLFFYYGTIASQVKNIEVLILIGYFLVVFNCLLFASIGLFKKVTTIILAIARWFKKFKLFRKIDLVALEEYCDNVRIGFRELWAKPLNIFFVVLTKTVAWLLFYSIPFFILKGVHADITMASFWYTIAVASFTAVTISFVPTPGGVGAAEIAFSVFFIVFLKTSAQATSAMLIWRVITYYLPAIISFICYLDFERRVGIDNANRNVY